jgi:hypothetical protein
MPEGWLLVVAQSIDDTQRTLMHELIKSDSDEWWHGFPDVWMVRGDSAEAWRERLGVFVPRGPSAVLVFQMPDEGGRAWSARGVKSGWEWLTEHYASPRGGAPVPSIDKPDA